VRNYDTIITIWVENTNSEEEEEKIKKWMMGIGKLSSDQVSIGHGDDYMERNELSQNH